MAIAAVGGLAAGVAAASSSHTTIRTSGPRGTHVTRISYHDGSNGANAALISGATIGAASSVQEKGRRDAAAIGDQILGLTTVDPGDSYGGRVVIDKIKAPLPQTSLVSVKWNGEVYASKWQLVPDGTPAPVFEAAAEPAPSAATAPVAAVPPAIASAVLATSEADLAPARPVTPVAASRPKQYPHDDTVQTPM